MSLFDGFETDLYEDSIFYGTDHRIIPTYTSPSQYCWLTTVAAPPTTPMIVQTATYTSTGDVTSGTTVNFNFSNPLTIGNVLVLCVAGGFFYLSNVTINGHPFSLINSNAAGNGGVQMWEILVTTLISSSVNIVCTSGFTDAKAIAVYEISGITYPFDYTTTSNLTGIITQTDWGLTAICNANLDDISAPNPDLHTSTPTGWTFKDELATPTVYRYPAQLDTFYTTTNFAGTSNDTTTGFLDLENPEYITTGWGTGIKTISSNKNSWLTAVPAVLSQKMCWIRAWITTTSLTSSKNCYMNGTPHLSSKQYCFIDSPLFSWNSINAYIGGPYITISSSQPAYMLGSYQIQTQQNCWINSNLVFGSNIRCYIPGAVLTISSSVGVYMSAASTRSSIQLAYISNTTPTTITPESASGIAFRTLQAYMRS